MDAFIGKIKKKLNNEREVVRCARSHDGIRQKVILFENQGQYRVPFFQGSKLTITKRNVQIATNWRLFAPEKFGVGANLHLEFLKLPFPLNSKPSIKFLVVNIPLVEI